jgi:hypothetical protein
MLTTTPKRNPASKSNRSDADVILRIAVQK